jgi:hypothetical protein
MTTNRYVPSDALVERFRSLYHDGWLSTLFLWLGGQYLETNDARRLLQEIAGSSFSSLVYYKYRQNPAAQFPMSEENEDLLVGGLMTRMPRLNDRAALALSVAIVEDIKRQLGPHPLVFSDYEVSLKDGVVLAEVIPP